ncbi:MAG: 30S ribosomal protein S4 [Candidatus Aenigmatarchaeota archaeon]|nr:MAG: 30S ribosomal protein S4 [Candidatus Aenigmarchaeota archaeon]
MRRIGKRFKKPRMSWESDDIKERHTIMKNYGLRRRREVLIAQEILRNYRRRARELIAEQDEAKVNILVDKLVKLGLLRKGQGLDDVLALNVNDILERRLQTIVWKKVYASTPLHSRQSITHGHVTIDSKRVKSPAYMVPVEEESKIVVSGASNEKGGK